MDVEAEIRDLWRAIQRLQLSDKLIVASTRSSLVERYDGHAGKPELYVIPDEGVEEPAAI